MSNFSDLNTEEMKEVSEDFNEIGKKLAEVFDSLAILHDEHKQDTMDIPNHLVNLADTLIYIESAKNQLGQIARDCHLRQERELSEEEHFLASFG